MKAARVVGLIGGILLLLGGTLASLLSYGSDYGTFAVGISEVVVGGLMVVLAIRALGRSGKEPPHRVSTGQSAILEDTGLVGIQPSRRKAAGLMAAGVALMGLGLTVAFNGAKYGIITGIFSYLIALGLLAAATKVILRARRLALPAAEVLLRHDSRPPVIYLRSFSADRSTARGMTFTTWVTEEEQIARAMQDVGPFLAIGEPDELLPQLGAVRAYVRGRDWQQIVGRLAARSRLVIFRIGHSPSLTWEFKTVLRQLRPEKVVLFVPRDGQAYEQFRHEARTVLPSELPALDISRMRKPFRGSTVAVIVFAADWAPTVIDLRTISISPLRRSPMFPLVALYRAALAPAMTRLGIRWKPPAYDRDMAFTVVGLLVMLAAPFVPFVLAS